MNLYQEVALSFKKFSDPCFNIMQRRTPADDSVRFEQNRDKCKALWVGNGWERQPILLT